MTRTPERNPSNPRRTNRWSGPIALSLGALIAATVVGNTMVASAASITSIQEDGRKERGGQDAERTRDRNRQRDNAQDRGRKQGARGRDRQPDGDRDDARVSNNRIGVMLIKLGEAVEAGEISAEDAMRRILGIAERMNLRERGDNADDAGKKRRYEAAAREIKEAVREGTITKEQAGERLEGLKKRLWGDEGKSRTNTREDYTRAEKKLKDAVRSGEISEEDARKRLGEMRKRMGDAGARKKDSGNDKDNRRRKRE